MPRHRLAAKCLDFLFDDAGPPHGLGHLPDDAEVIAGAIKSHEYLGIFGGHRSSMRRYGDGGKVAAGRDTMKGLRSTPANTVLEAHHSSRLISADSFATSMASCRASSSVRTFSSNESDSLALQ
jgi:hypothetical protein